MLAFAESKGLHEAARFLNLHRSLATATREALVAEVKDTGRPLETLVEKGVIDKRRPVHRHLQGTCPYG